MTRGARRGHTSAAVLSSWRTISAYFEGSELAPPKPLAPLIRRTSRSMALTDAGQTFYEAGTRLVADLDAAESLVGHGQNAPSGLVRVTAAPAFGRLFIVPQLPAFFARYPDITVELNVSERTLNLVEEGLDLAIHNGPLADSKMVARRIGSTPVVTVAAPNYLEAHGAPLSPSDLERACVVFAPRGEPALGRIVESSAL